MDTAASHRPDAARIVHSSDAWTRPAAAHACAAVAIDASADRVWQLLTGIDAWPRWNPAVGSARLEGSIAAGTVFRWRSQGFTVSSTLVDVEMPRRLMWTGRALGTRARHEWDIVAAGHGVVVKTSETFDGWLPRLMPRTMKNMLERTLSAWLEALKAEAERSEVVGSTG